MNYYIYSVYGVICYYPTLFRPSSGPAGPFSFMDEKTSCVGQKNLKIYLTWREG